MIDLHIWEFPLSVLAAAAFAVAVSLCRRTPGRGLSAGLAVLCALLMAVEGTWAPGLHRHWAFLAFMAVLMFALGTVCADALRSGLRRDRSGSRGDGGRSDGGRSVGSRSDGGSAGSSGNGGRFWRPDAGVWSHLGLLLILSGAFFGAPDVTDVTMVAERGKASHFAWNAAGETVPLPFELRLEDFTIDYYEDGVSPKQYTSTLHVGDELREVSVNRPLRIGGYRIYQSDYDHEGGSYSVLKVVRNPWLPLVYSGMAMLVLAALAGLRKTWQSKAVIPIAIVLAAVFGAISLARVKLGTLMPALRSLWFVPHIIAYMLAYSALALALVCGILGLCGGSRRASRSRRMRQDGGVPCVDEPARVFIGEPAWKSTCRLFIGEPAWKLSRRLLETASALLAVGMFCGSVWAQNSWGDWWAWDAKECWAAATWLLTLAGTHLPAGKEKAVPAVIALAFLAMQVTWYGVDYLPAARTSLHTYTQSK